MESDSHTAGPAYCCIHFCARVSASFFFSSKFEWLTRYDGVVPCLMSSNLVQCLVIQELICIVSFGDSYSEPKGYWS